MSSAPLPRSELEEQWSAITHGAGGVVALVGTVALGWVTWRTGDPYRVAACLVYGVSLCLMFLSSTLYHHSRHPGWRFRFLQFDYTAIYLLIAGSYTPYALVTLRDTSGWWLFGTVWVMAVAGVVWRLWGNRHWPWFSTGLYVAMGWGGALLAWPLLELFPWAGLVWLVAGGVSYTVGAAVFMASAIPFNHVIWHVAVMIGAACHFVPVWAYVAPA